MSCILPTVVAWMHASMSNDSTIQAQRVRESLAHAIALAAEMADRLDLSDVATILRDAEDAAKTAAAGGRGHDWRSMLR